MVSRDHHRRVLLKPKTCFSSSFSMPITPSVRPFKLQVEIWEAKNDMSPVHERGEDSCGWARREEG